MSTTEQTFNLTVTEATDDAGVDEMPEENAAVDFRLFRSFLSFDIAALWQQ